jgi:hypothetical protein
MTAILTIEAERAIRPVSSAGCCIMYVLDVGFLS